MQRYFTLLGVQPHRTTGFTLSTDPFFVDEVRDIVGLYLNPPDHALVPCVDERSQLQALKRTQPLLLLSLGYVEGVTHGYVRHGTTTLFAALDVATGQVLAQCKPRHRHQEFLAFFAHIDANVPPDLDVHLIIDNYRTPSRWDGCVDRESAYRHARIRKRQWAVAATVWNDRPRAVVVDLTGDRDRNY